MHIHRFNINEVERRARPGYFHHLRRFLTIYRGNPDAPDYNERRGKLFAGHLETIVKKPRAEFSARFHIGTKGSETPFDGHLTILGTGVYWGIESGGRLAGWITREKRHQYEGRDFAVSICDGSLSLRLWVHADTGEHGEFAKWRSAYISLSILDRIYGQKKYTYENLAEALIAIDMPEGTYPVRATLQLQKHGRPKSKRHVDSHTVDVEAPKGIPTHYDKSGGWKGDRTYGFGVAVKRHGDDWALDAKNAITARVFQYRADSGFREPQEADAL